MSVDIKLANKHLREMRKYETELREGKLPSQIINFSFKQGFFRSGNTACAAGLSYVVRSDALWDRDGKLVCGKDMDPRNNLNAILSFVVPRRYSKGYVRPFLRWLLNDSLVSDIFVTKDVEAALKRGIIITPHVNIDKLACGVIMLRTLTEHVGQLPSWHGLVKRGVSPDMAYLISHHCEGTTTIIKAKRSHSCLMFSLTSYHKEGVSNWLNGKFIKAPNYIDALNYGRSSRIVVVEGGWNLDQRLSSFEYVYQDKPSISNPFSKAFNHKIDFGKSLDRLAPMLIEIEKECRENKT